MRAAASVIPGNRCGSGAVRSSALRKSAASSASASLRARMVWMSGSLWSSGRPSRSGTGSTQIEGKEGPRLMARCGDTSRTYVILLHLSIIRAGEVHACAGDCCALVGFLGETMGNSVRARAEYWPAWDLRSVAVTAIVLLLTTILTPL